MKIDSIYICSWSLQDSLCQSQTLAYLRGLTAGGYKFALVTFETAAYKVSRAAEIKLKADLAAEGILWYPVRFREGTSLLNKLRQNIDGLAACIAALKNRPALVHSRGSLPLGLSLALQRLFGLKFLYDADSILSEEYAETGHWSRVGNSYKLMSKLENSARRSAHEVIVLTETLRADFEDVFGVSVPIAVIPCCVDTEKFAFSADGRKRRRGELGLTDEKLLTYVGKSGARYLVEETFDFFKVFNSEVPASRLLIVSRDDAEIFHRIAEQRGVSKNLYFVKSAAFGEVCEWLSASDVGLGLIRQMVCERGSSPVKFAEYLSVGLPVVVTSGIGDFSRLVAEKNIGVVLERADKENYRAATARLLELLGSEPEKLADRCRKTAEENFGVQTVGIERYRKIYERFLRK